MNKKKMPKKVMTYTERKNKCAEGSNAWHIFKLCEHLTENELDSYMDTDFYEALDQLMVCVSKFKLEFSVLEEAEDLYLDAKEGSETLGNVAIALKAYINMNIRSKNERQYR